MALAKALSSNPVHVAGFGTTNSSGSDVFLTTGSIPTSLESLPPSEDPGTLGFYQDAPPAPAEVAPTPVEGAVPPSPPKAKAKAGPAADPEPTT